MLKIKVDSDTRMISCNGSFTTILTEMCIAVNGVYESIARSDPALAETFRRGFGAAVTAPGSPVFRSDVCTGTTIFAGGVFKKPHE